MLVSRMWKLYPSRKFVFAVDGSEFCRISFSEALKIMNPCDTLHLVQVRNPPGRKVTNSVYPKESWTVEYELCYSGLFRAVLDEFLDKATLANVQCRVVELFGDSKEQLMQYCSKEDSCILLIGCPASILQTSLIMDKDNLDGSNYSVLLFPVNYQMPL